MTRTILAPGGAGVAAPDAGNCFIHNIPTQNLGTSGQLTIDTTPLNGWPTATDPTWASVTDSPYNPGVNAVIFPVDGLYRITMQLRIGTGSSSPPDGILTLTINYYNDWAPATSQNSFLLTTQPQWDTSSVRVEMDVAIPFKMNADNPSIGFDLAYGVNGATVPVNGNGQLQVYKLA